MAKVLKPETPRTLVILPIGSQAQITLARFEALDKLFKLTSVPYVQRKPYMARLQCAHTLAQVQAVQLMVDYLTLKIENKAFKPK